MLHPCAKPIQPRTRVRNNVVRLAGMEARDGDDGRVKGADLTRDQRLQTRKGHHTLVATCIQLDQLPHSRLAPHLQSADHRRARHNGVTSQVGHGSMAAAARNGDVKLNGASLQRTNVVVMSTFVAQPCTLEKANTN